LHLLPEHQDGKVLLSSQNVLFHPRSQNHESDQEEVEEEEWQPKESAPQQMKKTEGMTTKPVAKNATKSREPKAKAVRKPAAKRAVAPKVGLQEAPTPAMKREEEEPAAGTLSSSGMESWWMVKEEVSIQPKFVTVALLLFQRLSFPVQSGQSSDAEGAGGSRPCFRQELLSVKNEDPGDDFTFEEPPPKKIKLSSAPQGKPVKRQTTGCSLSSNIHMNWDLIEVLSERMQLERWVCANLVQLFQEENTIPFIVRYRKEIINHMDADDVREVQLALEELCTVSKKCQSICQTLKKEGVLNAGLEEALKNCRTRDELEHVYAPYKKGSKLSKARRAKQLGLDPAAQALLQTPQTLSLHSWVKPHIQGVSTLEEVATGVEQILADMMAKDKETLAYVRSLCDRNTVTIHSSLSKTRPVEKPGKPKDIDKFHLYYDFTCDVRRIQHHQILAINRGENLKILTVKVNIPDWVKSEFCRWCVNVRWRPKAYAREDLMKILNSAVEDSYKRLIMPLLCRSYRSSLTAAAEKESVAMFVRNLRRRLLACPVRGRVIMGVDPGFKHGCKLAILSPTSQILHTDVVYLHCARGTREADKLRNLMMKYNCQTLVIEFPFPISCFNVGSFFFSSPFHALLCAVLFYLRVQDPLAELVKIDPKHIGIGTYQHDMSQASLKSALGGVVEECVSFVGVDVNMCSETLLRHVAGLNAGRARSIVEWREKSGPFINREQLKLVKGLGPKSFQQCAGFIRINPEHFQTLCRYIKPNDHFCEYQRKTSVLATPQLNALDQTCIHPESYSIAQRFLALIEGRMEEIGQQEMKERVEAALRRDSLEKLAKTLDTSLETLQLIVDGLTQPPSFDIRQNFEQADFKQGIVSMSDLQKGVVLTGRVENTTLFGAFVDIGVGCSGLIHKQYITPGKLPADLQRRSLALGPGERVEVRVLSVDMQRRRIGLDLIRVLR
uniref:S1 RNA-binding domain-containing protein 1 n=1 Tax=Scleropages formosus TaxID=113540 RepID=A0A8C9WQ00_SCLFO